MKITDYVHLLCLNHLKDTSIVIDATCGNGLDTYFLAEIVKKGKVIAYDIQEIAINNTKELCKAFDNIEYHLESFTNIEITNCDLVLFNLGYLPNGDKNITTKTLDTIYTINKLIHSYQDNPNMKIIITVYPGHNEGLKESEALNELLLNLDNKLFEVIKIIPINQHNSPYILTIEKKHR